MFMYLSHNLQSHIQRLAAIVSGDKRCAVFQNGRHKGRKFFFQRI
ncbi:MAG TPA: hypothetical protein ENH53_11040 [Bacteroidetes bacterium]|nr:hypothetical protein [Bacteroidota bacterium]